MTARSRPRAALAVLAAWVCAAALLVALPVALPATVAPVASASAANAADWNPGNIIDDASFYDGSALSASDIQAFLQKQVPNCRSGYTCLKDYRQNTDDRPADKYCNGYAGAANESAATIIAKVGLSCGISQKAMLVLLEKEQRLVSSTWPEDFQYKAATGQGCPDTAPCDASTAGFFYQVYYAARQFEIYRLNPTWWGYQAGRWNNILYNPTTSCGTQRVYIENAATAGLYIYTPYVPNAAALRNLYGEGDGCSAYGNRNFWRIYTDWFGSTHQQIKRVVSVNGDIYLTSGGRRYHMPPHAWPQWQLALGDPTPVSADYLTRFVDAGDASLYIRNSTTGAVYYLDAKQLHYFNSCELIGLWGGNCQNLIIDVTGDDLATIPVGGPMSPFGRLDTTGPVYQLSGSRLVPMYDGAVASTFNYGTEPYAALLPGSVAARYTVSGVTRFATGRFILFQGDSRVWLPTSDGRLFYLPSWLRAAEAGLPSTVFSTGVPISAAKDWPQIGNLEPFVGCGTGTYYAASGQLRPVTRAAAAGFTIAALDSDTCAALNIASESAGLVFIRPAGDTRIFYAVNGAYRHVTSVPQLQALAGTPSPRVLTVGSAAFTLLPLGPAY
ncbi:MAG: hypothetical protein IJO71_02085 [Microbacterium sp.]|uniref:hypothetical protein n=1 Tax=Microbacterium sp. TaxID=51671 RepID=UPI0025CC91CC|nr:hypothetical protein [Microbacterium sp.]MBQ9915971.1 hypothetical protein [Microbacterium sp.]